MSFLFLKNISKQFKTPNGDFYALKNINLEFESEGFVAIEGKSGSGKSTLLNIIFGIEKASEGSIFINNKICSNKRRHKSSFNEMSIIFQHYNLFNNLTLEENIMMPLLIKGRKQKEINERCNELIHKLALDSLKGRKCLDLSGGEKQRVAIARALISNPSVLLCDEPTGALDESNSNNVMEILKDIAKERLVIIVSHNHKLVKEHCSRIITLKDGVVIDDVSNLNLEKKKRQFNKISKHKTKWKNIFVKKHLKSNLLKNILVYISSTFGLLATLMSIGFSSEIKETSKTAAINNLYVTTATVSKKEYIEIQNSPLQYERSTRPNNEELSFLYQSIPSLSIEPNISFFISNCPTILSNGKSLSDVSFLPIISNESIHNFNDVIVNDAFVNQYRECLNDLTLDIEVIPSLQTSDINNPIIRDNFALNCPLNVVSIVEEFSFLNTPKIYYSYSHMFEYLSSIKLANFSAYFGYDMTCLDYILESKDDSLASGFSSYLFINDKRDIDLLFNIKEKLDKEEANIRIDSNVYSIVDSYVTFMSSFSSSLNAFIIISFVGVNFILGIASLSSFIANKKESAILSVFGATHTDILSIFLDESISVVVLSLLTSFLLMNPLQKLINKIVLNKARIPDVIKVPFLSFNGYPLVLPILLTLVTIFVSAIFVLIPLLIYKNLSLTSELKDE